MHRRDGARRVGSRLGALDELALAVPNDPLSRAAAELVAVRREVAARACALEVDRLARTHQLQRLDDVVNFLARAVARRDDLLRPVHRHRALRLLHGERGDGDLVVGVGRGPALLLADFGADAVKIEPPGGDGFRNWPPQVDSGEGEPYGISFAVLNRRLAALLIRRQMPRGLRDD